MSKYSILDVGSSLYEGDELLREERFDEAIAKYKFGIEAYYEAEDIYNMSPNDSYSIDETEYPSPNKSLSLCYKRLRLIHWLKSSKLLRWWLPLKKIIPKR